MIFQLIWITLSHSQIIDVDFSDSNRWFQSIQNIENCTFRVSSSQEKYIYVNVLLSEPNPNLLLVSQELTAVSNFLGTFKEGSTIDMISVHENRRTRFLKIKVSIFPLYISTFDQTLKSFYEIIIEASSEERCDNNCSNQGICTQNGCKCQENYIGNNCNTEASEIVESFDTQLYLQDYPIFFYINLGNYQGESLELSVTTDNYEGIWIFVEKSQANYVPSLDYNKNLVQEESVFDSIPLSFPIVVPQEIQSGTLLVFVAIQQGGNYNTISTTIDIQLQSISSLDNSAVSPMIIIIIVVSIIVAIIIIITIFCIFKTIKRRKLMESANQLRPQLVCQTYKSPMEIQSKYNFVEVQTVDINPQDTCSICLDTLVNGKELNQTLCKHNFHQQCILAWVQKHKDCPICRSNLITKEV